MDKPISLFAPFGGPEESAAVSRVLSGQWWGRGPEVAAFEAEFATYTGWRYCVTTNSCTAALQLAVRCLDLPRASWGVAVPSMTFCSDAHVVAQEGHRIHWLDCDQHGQAMLPREWPRHMRAAIAVHFGGRPMDLSPWQSLQGRIIEDCAHSLGSDQRPQGWCACYSFHAVKPLACGDGGAICTNDPALAERARRLAWLGIDRGTSERAGQAGGYTPGYTIPELGFKCHWNDLLASIGREQLRRLPATTARRRAVAERYRAGLAQMEADYGIGRPEPCPGSSWHIYPVQVTDRDAVAAQLRAAGIATGVHYQPLHRMPVYGTPGDCPGAERWAARTLSLPCHAGLSDADVDRVIETLTKAVRG